MLHIILLILKILGIILACIIGLILLLICLILFVPIRYKGEASFEKKPLYTLKVGWLLGIISVWLTNVGGKTRFCLKVMGFSLKDTGREKKPEKNNQKKKESKEKTNKKSEKDVEKSVSSDLKNEPKENDHTTEYETNVEDEKVSGKPEQTEIEKVSGKSEQTEIEKVSGKSKQAETEEVSENEGQTEEKNAGAKKKQKGILAKLGNIKNKVLGIKTAIINKLKGISAWFKKIKDKKDKLFELLFSDDSKAAILRAKVQLFKVLAHLKPRKISGNIYFGTGDAYSTARILCVLGVMYPLYDPAWTVTPDFERQVIEGSIRVKGRIRLMNLLWAAAKLYFDKDLKRMITGLKEL